MRRMHRIVLLAGLVALAPVLAGCEDFDMDKFDFFHLNDKKKLPGERKEVFPEGVPGVTQGIPPEYLKGNQPQPDTAQAPAPDAPPPRRARRQNPPRPRRQPRPPRSSRRPSPSRKRSRSASRSRARQRVRPSRSPRSRRRRAKATASSSWRPGRVTDPQQPALWAEHGHRALAFRAAARHLLALTPLSG